MSGRVEFCAPDFVQGLMLSPPESHGCSKTQVEVAEILKSVYQGFSIELRPVASLRFNQETTC